jgi:hypothetical protein
MTISTIMAAGSALVAIGGVLSAKRSAVASERSAVASERSAVASEKSAQEAKRTADAAERQATAAEQQVETTRSQLVAQSDPLIIPGQATVGNVIRADFVNFQNQGTGIARNLKLTYKDGGAGDEIPITQRNLGAGDSFTAGVDGSRAARAGLKLKYESSLGLIYELTFIWNG